MKCVGIMKKGSTKEVGFGLGIKAWFYSNRHKWRRFTHKPSIGENQVWSSPVLSLMPQKRLCFYWKSCSLFHFFTSISHIAGLSKRQEHLICHFKSSMTFTYRIQAKLPEMAHESFWDQTPAKPSSPCLACPWLVLTLQWHINTKFPKGITHMFAE